MDSVLIPLWVGIHQSYDRIETKKICRNNFIIYWRAWITPRSQVVGNLSFWWVVARSRPTSFYSYIILWIINLHSTMLLVDHIWWLVLSGVPPVLNQIIVCWFETITGITLVQKAIWHWWANILQVKSLAHQFLTI